MTIAPYFTLVNSLMSHFLIVTLTQLRKEHLCIALSPVTSSRLSNGYSEIIIIYKLIINFKLN